VKGVRSGDAFGDWLKTRKMARRRISEGEGDGLSPSCFYRMALGVVYVCMAGAG
jgi:hypothetical protein